MTGWMLALFLEGSKAPDITAGPYKTEQQCFMAGDLMKAADKAARKLEQLYTISCTEQQEAYKNLRGSGS